MALVAKSGTKSQVPDLPVVDPKTSPHLWAVVDTACNTSVCSEGWIEKGKKIWEGYGYQPIRTSSRTGPYGGLAGDATAQMVGKISFPLVIIGEANEKTENWAVPATLAANTNQVAGDVNFLMGLDLQRHLRIRLDVVSNVCMRQLVDGTLCDIKLAQAAGSGLLIIRVDEFPRLASYLEWH